MKFIALAARMIAVMVGMQELISQVGMVLNTFEDRFGAFGYCLN
jgi:hypothetical protein